MRSAISAMVSRPSLTIAAAWLRRMLRINELGDLSSRNVIFLYNPVRSMHSFSLSCFTEKPLSPMLASTRFMALAMNSLSCGEIAGSASSLPVTLHSGSGSGLSSAALSACPRS